MKRSFLILLLSLNACLLFGQTDSSSKSGTEFTFSVDGYYRVDLNQSPLGTNNYGSFTNTKNSFELGMASVRADHHYKNISATIDLGFGRRASEFSYNDTGILSAVKQLYISYAPSSAIKFSFGKWATHIGYEMVDAYANRNYSMSYAFSYGPFFNTGLKADIQLGGKSAMMIGISNPTDFTTTKSSDKVVLAQFSSASKNEKIKGWFNFQGGKDFTQYEIILTGIVSQQLSLNYDGTIKNQKKDNAYKNWNSNALYVTFDPTKRLGICVRAEYFNDSKNVAGLGTSVFQTTLSGSIHIHHLTIIPEFRFDNANDQIFNKANGSKNRGASSIVLAAVYKF